MIDTLVAFGCSHTYGSEAIVAGDCCSKKNIYFSYAYYLSKKLEIKHYINKARSGASNLEIAYNIVNHLYQSPSPTSNRQIILIGWSGDRRFPIVNNNKILTAMVRDVDSDKSKVVHQILNGRKSEGIFGFIKDHFLFNNKKDIFRFLLDYYFLNTDMCVLLNVLVKFAVITLLECRGIPYITIPTILYVNHDIYKLFAKKNNITCYNDDNDIVFDFLSFKKSTLPKLHLTSSEHKVFADYLYNFIKENNIM